jgi:hypothetical protein
MTVAVVDSLICCETVGIWVRGERWCFVLWTAGSKWNWGIVVLDGFEIFIERFEHSDLKVLV